jgi:hypothetical protein
VRIERVELEHHSNVALRRAEPRHVAPAQSDHAARRQLEAGDHAQRGRLAATGRTEQHDELPLLGDEVDAIDRACPIGIGLLETLEMKKAHAPSWLARWCDV